MNYRRASAPRSDAHPTHIHTAYHLTCPEYDQLLERAAGACEICGQQWADPPLGPQIDHDHNAGELAVRGLVCRKCNSRMRHVDSGLRAPDAQVRRYLDNAWYQNEGREAYAEWRRIVDDPGYELIAARRRRAGVAAARRRLGLVGEPVAFPIRRNI